MSINDQSPLTPPPAPQPTASTSTPTGPGAPAPAGRTWITVALAVFGGLVLAGTGATAAVAAGGGFSSGSDSVQRVDVDGVDSLDLDASAADVHVVFADIDQAELSVTGGGDWRIDREDDELVVRSPDTIFGWWFGSWFDRDNRVVLTLPESLEGIDGSFLLSAGSLDVDGRFGELDVEVSAGDLTVGGSADSLDAELSAGSADLVLDGVRAVDLTVSAGDLTVELTGTAPRETRIETSAGSADVTMPEGSYRVSEDVSAGTLDNRLETSSSAQNSIDVALSAGTVTLRPGS